MPVTQTFVGTLAVFNCAECSIPFGITQTLEKQLRENHKTFYCPKGHTQHFPGKSDTERLREEIHENQVRISNLHDVLASKNGKIQSLEYSVRAQKAAKTKIMNRVKNGVCPCCNRSFQDLQQHFKTKHPELL